MPCFYPLPANRPPNGGRLTIYSRLNPPPKFDLNIPCGKCIGCYLDRSKAWSIRLMHEAQLHERTSFLTLTYDDKRSPSGAPNGEAPFGSPPNPSPDRPRPSAGLDRVRTRRHFDQEACQDSLTRLAFAASLVGSTRSLDKTHLQKFMKSLRSDLDQRSTRKIKFYACGEYGTKLGRPHYHVALFGEDFREDRYKWRSNNRFTLYRSATLEKLWKHGNCEIGELTTDSAMYIANYLTKSVNGPMAKAHYTRVHPLTLELYEVDPEFSVMSRGGRKGRGLAHQWFETYSQDIYPEDHVITRESRRMKPPRYYDKLLKEKDPITSAVVTMKREARGKLLAGDNTPARLADKEAVTLAKLAQKKRKLE